MLAVLALISASTPDATRAQCAGDCDGDSAVTVDEIVRCVNIALGSIAVIECVAADLDVSESVTVDEVITAVDRALSGCAAGESSPTATATGGLPTPTSTPDAGGEPIPTSRDELIDWLEQGIYMSWPAESAVHASAGPHFGQVRTFVNPILFGSLSAASPMHPQGAAVVKELYGANPAGVRGWSVMIKNAADSDGGRAWYFLEVFDGGFYASSFGAGVCVGCHHADYFGLQSKDFVLTPFPLQ
jgi:hypothetical protein